MKISAEIARTHSILEKQQEIIARSMRLVAQSQQLRKRRHAAVIFNAQNGNELIVGNNDGLAANDTFIREMIRIQEAERARIARELHDEFGQALTAIKLELEMAMGEDLSPNSMLTQRIKHIKSLVERTTREMQRLAYDLRPVLLDDIGLIPALRALGEDFSRQTGIKVGFDLISSPDRFSRDLELALYRVAQEGLTNIAKHAQAKRVNIRLQEKKGCLELVIEDNGIGFDLDSLKNRSISNGKHMGINGMRERLRVFGGVLIIRSRPGRGTSVRARITSADQQ